jgi:pimeloyl-ACP methyl ester carboxylesterase
MKAFRIFFTLLRWIFALLILLFALATFFGGNYGQTICLALIAIILVYWPVFIKNKLGKTASISLRLLALMILVGFVQWVFISPPKTSIYRTEQHQQDLIAEYNKCLQAWPTETKEYDLSTQYGTVHVLEVGNATNPPLVMLHAASMGAHSWAENLAPVLDSYRVFAIDNIGEGNKSVLIDALVFPSSPQEVADFYNALFDQLEIDSAVVFGASNGGFIAQNLAYYHPEKVRKLILFGPMGLTQLTTGSIGMMILATMYPFQFLRDAVSNWAIGRAPACQDKYGDWFNAILKGTIPSVTAPIPMTAEQKQKMDLPVLLFLGSNDKIVGDTQAAEKRGEEFPNIQIEILSSGHLIAVEQRDMVNQKIAEFLSPENL